jgi:hypothetical protein
MLPNFEMYRRPDPPRDDTPTVTISRTSLHMNRHALDLLGRPGTVELLCDPKALIVGIRPAPGGEEATTFKVHTTRDGGGGRVDARGFADRYNLPVETPRRWLAYLDGGVLCVNVRDASESMQVQVHINPPQPTGSLLGGQWP